MDYDDMVSQLELTVDLRKEREREKMTTDWKDPLNRLIWQQAFKVRATKMTLRDGTVFKIKYEPGHIDRYGNAITKAWVQIDGWVSNGPCGWFIVEKVLDPTWVSEDAGKVKTTGVTSA